MATRLLHADPALLHRGYRVALGLLQGCYTVVSSCFSDFAGYKHILGGNLESKSDSRPVYQDSDGRDLVAGIQVTAVGFGAS